MTSSTSHDVSKPSLIRENINDAICSDINESCLTPDAARLGAANLHVKENAHSRQSICHEDPARGPALLDSPGSF
jgi:hypothetical protein